MSALFLIGNGFDIAHGIPSQYCDFRSFIIQMYPEALGYRDDVVYLEDAEHIDAEEFAAEILLHSMDKVSGENWSNFEDALAYIDFSDKLPVPNHKENETELEDHELMKQYILYIDALTSGFIKCSQMWQEYFRLWIKEIETQIEKGTFAAKPELKLLFGQKKGKFITFNYTKTLQELYGIKKVIHIHNRTGQKLIFGHGQDNVTYGEFMNSHDGKASGLRIGSTFLDEMLLSFRKDTGKQLKKYNKFFKELNSEIDEVYSYGFSYGKVDGIYIKNIVNKISPNAIWYFTKFESENKEMLRVKKVKLRRYGFKGKFGIFV